MEGGRRLLLLLPLLALRIAAVAGQFSGGPYSETTSIVNCGGQFAEDCSVCSQGHGDAWCNGDCMWTGDSCELKSSQPFLSRFAKLQSGGLAMYALPLFFTGLLYACFAWFYHKKVVDMIPHERIKDRGSDFNSWYPRQKGLFACFKHPATAMYTAFCMPLVAAKNYEVGHVVGYWPSCCLLFALTYSPFYCLGAIVRACWSKKLKRNLGYEPNPVQDCLLALFCGPCEVGRESLEVDEAAYVEVKCCCKVESKWVPEQVKEAFSTDGSGGFCLGFRKSCAGE